MSKSFAARALGLAGLALSLAACQFHRNPDQVKLTVWTSDSHVRRALSPAAERFSQETGVKVEIVVLNQNLTQQFRTASLAKRGPDVLLWANDVVGELAESGLIEPLDLTIEMKSRFIDLAQNGFTYKSRLYGYPLSMGAPALIYNSQQLSRPPRSLEELDKLAGQGFKMLLNFKLFYFVYPFFSAFGAEPIRGDSWQLDSPAMVNGATWLREYCRRHKVPVTTDRGIAISEFMGGRAAMIVDGPWALADLRSSRVPFQVAPIPGWKEGRARALVGVHGFMLRRSSEHKAWAKKLIETYFLNESTLIELARQDPRIPATKEGRSAVIAHQSDLKTFAELAEGGIPMPNSPAMASLWPVTSSALFDLFETDNGPVEILRRAVKKLESPR